jgi:hypothetical protein
LSKLGLFRLFGELVVVVCLVGCLDWEVDELLN